ncbi:MAG TPA: choice-of-anchor Q domain-containing protein, partial [Actinomycetota bacterium]|nr:choice-of-anchor Q domain-containing protein [Actinomycetota bacterium]
MSAGVVAGVAPPAAAATFTVDTTVDGVDADPGDGTCATASGACTLRAAVGEANALAGTDTITLSAGTYQLTIPNTEPDVPDDNSRGDLDVFGDSLTITGASAATTAIVGVQGDRGDRIIHVVGQNGPQHLTITGVTIRGGQAGFSGLGGGILVSGDDDELTLTSSVVADNADGGSAGGGIAVSNGGRFTMTRSVVRDNAGGCSGGGLALTGPSQIVESTISGNTAECGGGGIVASASAEEPDAARSPTTIVNSTISGNRSQQAGGGVLSSSPVTFTNVTITSNRAGGNVEGEAPGGGVYVGGSSENPDPVRFENTVLANNASLTGTQNNCGDETGGNGLTSGGGNAESGTSCNLTGNGDQSDARLELGPLANNGGPTPTHALGATSHAIDTGLADCPGTDQRGVLRPKDGDEDGTATCDAGAFELDPDAAPSDTTPPGITNVKDAPDPFTPAGRTKKSTKISFTLSEAATVTITIENRAGTVVRTVLNAAQKAAGSVAVRWNGRTTQRKVVKPGRYT